MCTYNGERYLQEQLDSIAAQDHLPDELVVVDDVSKDNTTTILRQFAERVPFPVRILINESNLGSTKNFEKAAVHCTGDILVFADQDDAWRRDRLSATQQFFLDNPDKDGFFSNATLIDGQSNPVGRTIFDEIQFTPEQQARWRSGKAYDILYYGYVVTGATMAIRRSVLERVLPFPTHIKYLIHDGWISLILALEDKIDFTNEQLISYRQHEHQQVGFKAPRKKVTLVDRLMRGREEKLHFIQLEYDRFKQLYELLDSRPDTPKEKLQLLAQKRDHLWFRANLSPFHHRRILPVLREYSSGNYRRFNGYWLHTVLGDLLEN